MTESPASAAVSWFAMVGPALAALRRKAGLSSADVALRAKVGKSQLSKYENGRELPRVESLARILDALGMDPFSFFYLVQVLGQDSTKGRPCVEFLLVQSRRRPGGVKLAETILEMFRVLLQGLDEPDGGA